MNISQFGGDSTLSNLEFKDGEVSFLFEDYDTDKKFRVSIKTNSFYSEASEEEGSVHLRLELISEILDVDGNSGIYIMPSEFNKQMVVNKKHYNLALGLRSKEYPFMFLASGSCKLLVCAVKNEKEISINEV